MRTRTPFKRFRTQGPLALVRQFIARINRADVDGLIELITDDHLFVDSLGHGVRGCQAVRRAWIGYFAMVPDYHVAIRHTFVEGRNVMVLGTAAGSYVSPMSEMPVGTWQVPAVWHAVIRRQQLAEWQIYVDNEPIRELMRKEAEGRSNTALHPTAADLSDRGRG